MRMVYLPTQVPVLGAKRNKVRALRIARGIPSKVALSRVQHHVEWLYGIGFSDRAIGAAAGLPETTVRYIRVGMHATVGIEQAARVKAVSHVPVPVQAHMMVPALGVQRRIHALWTLGHPGHVIGDRMEVSVQRVFSYCSAERVRGAVWFRAAEAYEELSAVPGTSRETRRRAVARGLSAPLDWEGLDIDHPDHFPIPLEDSDLADLVAVHRILRGEYRGEVGKPERSAVVDHAAVNGWSAARLADALRVSQVAAEAALVRARRKLRESEEVAS